MIDKQKNHSFTPLFNCSVFTNIIESPQNNLSQIFCYKFTTGLNHIYIDYYQQEFNHPSMYIYCASLMLVWSSIFILHLLGLMLVPHVCEKRHHSLIWNITPPIPSYFFISFSTCLVQMPFKEAHQWFLLPFFSLQITPIVHHLHDFSIADDFIEQTHAVELGFNGSGLISLEPEDVIKIH